MAATFMHRVLEDLHLVGLLDQGIGPDADLALAGGRHFVMVHLDDQAHLLAGHAHGGADVLVRIDRRHREVAALDARAMPLVALFVGRCREFQDALDRIDLVEAAVQIGAPAHAVEDEELVLRTEQRRVGDAGGLQIGLGALGQRTRIALIALHRRGLDDVAADVDRRVLEERIEHRRARHPASGSCPTR